jgi:hypothetical protein
VYLSAAHSKFSLYDHSEVMEHNIANPFKIVDLANFPRALPAAPSKTPAAHLIVANQHFLCYSVKSECSLRRPSLPPPSTHCVLIDSLSVQMAQCV